MKYEIIWKDRAIIFSTFNGNMMRSCWQTNAMFNFVKMRYQRQLVPHSLLYRRLDITLLWRKHLCLRRIFPFLSLMCTDSGSYSSLFLFLLGLFFTISVALSYSTPLNYSTRLNVSGATRGLYFLSSFLLIITQFVLPAIKNWFFFLARMCGFCNG